MEPDPLTPYFETARRQVAATDLSRIELGFETRLQARLREIEPEGLDSPALLRRLWKTLAACAAVVGFLSFWMLSGGHVSLDREAPHWALWGGADQSVNLFPH
ncbi:MAG: hypothetical protein KA004_12700 [Verrucomicrobiales bacterium]|nr:hypothetical protein [Verrucomicrobiales bacterium]